MNSNEKLMFDYLMGKVDENQTYYTEQLFRQDKADFVLMLLMAEGIIKEETIKEWKKAYMKAKNEIIIKELKENQLKKQ